MTAALYLVMGSAIGALALWLAQRRSQLAYQARAALHAALLALLLVSLGLLLQPLTPTDHTHAISQLQQMLGQAAQHMSLPLLGLAALQLARQQHWQPIAWGRLVIGLMLGFEVARRLDWQHGWLWIISLAGLAALGTAALLHFSDKRILACWLLSCIGLLLPVLSGATPLAALTSPSLNASGLLALFSGAALAVGLLANRVHNNPVLTDHPNQKAAQQ